jgi:predicted transposase YbfD/YdcC
MGYWQTPKIVQRMDLKKMNNKTQMDQKTNKKTYKSVTRSQGTLYCKHTENLRVLLALEMEQDTQIREQNRVQRGKRTPQVE